MDNVATPRCPPPPEEVNQVDRERSKQLHPVLIAGLSLGLVANLTILLSLPPVVLGKGAPYLPTFQRNLNAMFMQLKSDPAFQRRMARGDSLCFVDLGSGDGRVVFRAAKEHIFHQCIGYEINPLLNIYSNMQQFWFHSIQYASSTITRYNCTKTTKAATAVVTRFYRRDLWTVDLRDVDVVAVYGLGPIMTELGKKLKTELRPGSYVLSNVFSIPGWKPVHTSKEGTHLYMIP